MSLFGSKTKISVFSSAIPLANEDYNVISNSIIEAILQGRDIAQNIIHDTLSGISLGVNGMLNYAKNTYTLGLAAGVKHTTDSLDTTVIKDAIIADLSLSHGCLIDYSFLTELTLDFLLLPFLVNQRNFILSTGEISIFPSGLILDNTYGQYILVHKVTVEEITLNSDFVTATIKYKIISTYDETTENPQNEFLQLHNLVELPPTYFEEEQIISINPNFGHTYCIAKYWELNSAGEKIEGNNWWYYDITTKMYPAITVEYHVDADNHFFPVIPIRYDNEDLTAEDKYETDLYKTSKVLLRKMGLHINDLGDKINENPDVDEIDHAYVMWGVNLQSERQEGLRYLVEFFDYLYDEAVINQSDFINFQINQETVIEQTYSFNADATFAPGGVTMHSIVSETSWDGTSYQFTTVNASTAASLIEHGLNTAVQFKYITSHYVNGVIGPRGTCTKSNRESTGGYPVRRIDGQLNNNALILRHQETDTVYKEIIIVGLVHINLIYKKHDVVTRVSDVFDDPDEDNFVIPIHFGVTKRLPLTTRNELYLQSVHLIINGMVKTKVRWYQRSVFKWVMKIGSFIIAVWSQQYWLLAVGLAVEVLSKILSPELLALIQVLYIAYSIYVGNFTGASKGLTTAKQFLLNVTALADLSKVPMQLRLAQLKGEMEDLAAEQKLEMEELAEVAKQLDTKSFLDPGILLDSPSLDSYPNEGPTMFYTRTLQNNAGLLSLDIVQNYHKILLQLPKPDHSFALN